MTFENVVLAALTTSATREISALSFFRCDTVEEMDMLAANLEAILDGIAHKLSEDIYVIVRH